MKKTYKISYRLDELTFLIRKSLINEISRQAGDVKCTSTIMRAMHHTIATNPKLKQLLLSLTVCYLKKTSVCFRTHYRLKTRPLKKNKCCIWTL